MVELNDHQQAYFMLAIFILPALIVWTSGGMPSTRTDLGFLVAAVLSGILAFIKEYIGWKPTEKQASQ